MDTRWKLTLTGPPGLRAPDGGPVPDLSRRGLAILAYLAIQPRMISSRAALAALIWGDRGEAQARASLRQELSRLRKQLPPTLLRTSRDEVALDPAGLVVAEGGAGRFLEGFDLGAPDFEDWLREARLRSAERRREAHLDAAAAALRDGDAAAAARAADAALALDPLSEAAMALLLRAAAATGARTDALAAFARFRDRLHADLDAAPEPGTAALAEALAAGRAPPLPGSPGTAPGARRPVLAVLPFEEIGAASHDMFADGIVEEITATLSHVREFHVIARQSVFALGTARSDHAGAARRLGAAYLVEGTVQRAGDRVRINVQLVEAGAGRTLWSERHDDRLDDLFALQDRIASRVAGQISPSLRSAEIARARGTPPKDRSAYDLVLTAYPHFWSHRQEDNAAALALFDAALDRDPAYPLAMAMKAWCHAQQASYAWSGTPAEDRAQAQGLARQAASLETHHAPTLVAACAALSITSVDQTLPKTLIERALALDPNNAWGWLRSGWLHALDNQPQVALDHFDRAERLSPLDPFLFNIMFGRANAHAELGDLERAVALVQAGLNLAPGVTWAYRMLAAYRGALGDLDAAKAALRTYLAHYPDVTIRSLRESMAPAIFETQVTYVEGLRKAGMPEE